MNLDKLNKELKNTIKKVEDTFKLKDATDIVNDNTDLDDKISAINSKNSEIEEEDNKTFKDNKTSGYTKIASKEILSLFNAMTQRKELKNNIRTIPIELRKSGRTSEMVVDNVVLLSLNVDGNGSLTLNIQETDNSKKVFKFIIMPLIKVLNFHFKDSNLRFSNKKKADTEMVFNITQTIYVSSNQIKNKPVKIGQKIHFTNIKHGKFFIS